MMSLDTLRSALQSVLIERDREIDAILIGLVAREHVLLVGPPGTAKSLLCRSVAAGISGARYCERLLSPTSSPESVFGPISLSALREDRYEHVGAGSVTDAEIVFLDEFFRGSDAIRDTLLHLLGPERQALVGTRQVKAPLRMAVGAANTWAESSDQAAILDRWTIRREVRPLSPGGVRQLLDAERANGTGGAVAPVLSLADLDAVSDTARALPVSQDTMDALEAILAHLRDAGIRPSDRRTRGSLRIARAAAAIDGATEVLTRHLAPLADVLWDQPGEQAAKSAEIVGKVADPVGARLSELIGEIDEIACPADGRGLFTRSADGSGSETSEQVAAIRKLQAIETELAEIDARGTGNGRVSRIREHSVRTRIGIQAKMMGIPEDKARALLGGAS